MKKASIVRNTRETQIRGQLRIAGKGQYNISTGIHFFDHMLELFAKHGGFDLDLEATGDLNVDQHHTVEDVGIVLGQCFSKALGDRVGINRAGYFVMPMDESLAVVAVDLSGRPALVYHAPTRFRLVGDLQTELLHDFFDGFVNPLRLQPARSRAVRTIEPSQDRRTVQVFRAGHALCLLDGRKAERPAPEHQGIAGGESVAP